MSLKTNQSFSDFEDNLLSSRHKATLDFIEMKISRKILDSTDVVAAVNRHKFFPNAFNDTSSTIVRASGGNVNDLF